MSNRFLSTAGSGNTNLTNGSADLFINSLGISNLDQSLPLKTNASRELVTSKLDQTDVNNLQTDLNLKSELSYTKSDAARTNPPAGQMKTYFKNDGDFYKKDENGTETKIAGAGTGDVSGPSSSVDNTIPRFDATTGKIIQGSGVIIDDTNNMTVPGIVKTNAIEPNNDLSYDIGTTTKKYSSIYCTNFISGSRIIDVNSDVSSSAVNQIATFNATNGKTIKNSNVTIDASNNCVGMNNLTVGGLTDTQNLNVNGVINAGNNINNFGLITSQGYRMQLDNAVDIGESAKQVKDLYIKGNINTLGDIKYNKVSQNIQLGINAGGSTQGVGCVDNISIGQGSNPALTTGNNNISLGRDSGKLINTGLSNICIGNSSGQTISSGVGNILLGNNAGGTINTTGGNICIGNSSGQTLDGNSNVFIGSSSVGGNGITNAIAIGSSVTNNVSNSAVIGNAINNIRPSGNRGCDLGTNANQYKDFYGDRVILHTQAQSDKYYNKNGTRGIEISDGSQGTIKLTGSDYQPGIVNRVFTVSASGELLLSNAILDPSGNLTASNTTLDSLTLKNNLNFDLDNSHDLGTALTSARNVFYKSNLTGGSATFSGIVNTANIQPSTTNVSDIGSNTLKYKDLYLGGTLNAVNSISTSSISTNNTTTNLTIQATGNVNFQASPLNNTGTLNPNIDNTQDIGSSSLTYRNIYIKGDVLKNGSPYGVSGPSSSVDNTIPRFDATTGKIIQGSGVSIDDDDTILNANAVTFKGTGTNATANNQFFCDVNNNLVYRNNTGIIKPLFGPEYMGGSFYKKYAGNTSQLLYEDSDVRIQWDGANYQPQFLNKTFSGWWDASIALYQGKNQTTILHNHDDISSTFNTVYYFTDGGTLNTSYNMPAYASRLECHLQSEGQLPAPVFYLKFSMGASGVMLCVIDKYN